MLQEGLLGRCSCCILNLHTKIQRTLPTVNPCLQAHSCFKKACMVAGTAHVRVLPTTAANNYELQPADLEAAMKVRNGMRWHITSHMHACLQIHIWLAPQGMSCSRQTWKPPYDVDCTMKNFYSIRGR